MKLLTLNTHSLIESDYQNKLYAFVRTVAKLSPDIIALQEVNQSVDADYTEKDKLCGYFECDKLCNVKIDNHVMNAARLLYRNGIKYYWTWLKIKNGYGKYEEGIAVMSKTKIIEAQQFCVSKSCDCDNWKTRKLLGVKTENAPNHRFFSVHYGWWNDKDEPFYAQWEKTLQNLPMEQKIWLLGDFNNPASCKGEGYDMIKRSNWYDCYDYAAKRIGENTATGNIDGWKGQLKKSKAMRIDQIWHNQKPKVSEYRVIFDGKTTEKVSDHCGVLVECEV